ncbi:Gfo/Idh/MocA family protein [Alteromonas sp. BMJM2]|uniref:Gfo/Idh/MocA family protein n=1 Tax=Alteromonas sp. BMJM2 TaxID=2954241 RepID=UPI0022B50FD8|nr:Gfo/Idh/MocA family oxidoreductase [Alteromonas sp. BMJM2]
MSKTRNKVRMGMVGGGQGAFIGAVHRSAAAIDGEIELVCGAFSSSHENCLTTGRELNLASERCYSDFNTMFAAEAQLPPEKRMQFVSIVTPNHLHYAVAKAAIEAGFHVLSDKPATFTLQEAIDLKAILNQHNVLYGLTHTYTGYPLVREAKDRIAQGELGTVTKVVAEYSQGWLAQPQDSSNKQASWRLDPSRAGVSCCMGDIGVHAANLAEFVSGLEITRMCADLSPVVSGRQLDDDGNILMRFNNGAKGVLIASQISVGEENNLNIRIYGTKAGLEWHQQEPNTLTIRYNDKPSQVVRTGVGGFSPAAAGSMRIPAGHPEGYLEAFANLYVDFANQVREFDNSDKYVNLASIIPGIDDAIRGMAFIENCVAASQANEGWLEFKLANVL